MKQEGKVLVFSMINNLAISVIKVLGGLFYGLNSLYVDGMQTLSDFVTDIVCLISSKISKKKPTKYHPFGFGKIEYLTNLFIGIILFALAIFMLVCSFGEESVVPPISLLILLVVVFLMKLVAVMIMFKLGKKINSQLLITAVEESKADLYSTIGVGIITIVLQFSKKIPVLRYIDLIGSIIISLLVFKTALKIIIDNSLSIIGETDNNEDIKDKVKEIIYKHKGVEKDRMDLIMYGAYYKLQLSIKMRDNMKLKEAIQIEKDIKKSILQHRNLKIRYVTIYLTDSI